jgi:hypothetical protein
MFLSEDHMLRVIAQSEFGVPATWLQPVLMKALDAGHITREAYRKATVALIDAHFSFTSVDTGTLLNAVADLREIRVPGDFRKLASALGGPNAEIQSHLGVATRAITAIWRNEEIPFTARQALVGVLLEEIVKALPPAQVGVVLQGFIRYGNERLGDPEFGAYIAMWKIGHFL